MRKTPKKTLKNLEKLHKTASVIINTYMLLKLTISVNERDCLGFTNY